MTNPYAPPKAQLEQQILNTEGQGSLQGGINGEYDFSISAIIAEGWEKTNGAKWPILLAFLIYGVISGLINALQNLIHPDPGLLFQQHQFGAGFFWFAVSVMKTKERVSGTTFAKS